MTAEELKKFVFKKTGHRRVFHHPVFGIKCKIPVRYNIEDILHLIYDAGHHKGGSDARNEIYRQFRQMVNN